jgi:hypothetical protein
VVNPPFHKSLGPIILMLLTVNLAGCYVVGYALPRTLKGMKQDAKIGVERIPANTLLNPTVVLKAHGRTLLVSNSPEYLGNDTPLPSALYRDRIQGSFRVFYHHANTSRHHLTVAVAVTNLSHRAVIVYKEGAGQGNNRHPDVAGQYALSRYLASRNGVATPTLLSPGASVFFTPQVVAPGGTVSAVQDFTVLEVTRNSTLTPPLPVADGVKPALVSSPIFPGMYGDPALSDWTPANVMATVVVYRGAAPHDPAAVVVAPGPAPQPIAGTPYYFLYRGTFPHGDRYTEVSLGPGQEGVALSVDSAVSGPYSSAMTGEYELGKSAVDGLNGYINGNYGVIYSLRVRFGGESAHASLAFLIQPSGGFGHYAFRIDGDTRTSPFVSYSHAWWFYSALSYGSRDSLLLEMSLPGGSYGPQKLFFVPTSALGHPLATLPKPETEANSLRLQPSSGPGGGTPFDSD